MLFARLGLRSFIAAPRNHYLAGCFPLCSCCALPVKQSTDGTEPSHSHFRGDLSCTRGYEIELLHAAKARNPDILIYGLSWGAPGYVNNGTFFGPEMVDYQVQWVQCMKNEGIAVDYLGS